MVSHHHRWNFRHRSHRLDRSHYGEYSVVDGWHEDSYGSGKVRNAHHSVFFVECTNNCYRAVS